ncbi:MAG: acetyl-CoA hydrolase/transferase family protein, partial [Eubacteriales bacterium]
NMPFAGGDSFIHLSEIDWIVERDDVLIEVPMGKPGELEEEIARLVAGLVPDGAAVQLGIGALSDAIALALREKVNLGIHSGLFSEAMLELVESGAVTGMRKEINPRKVVAATVTGTSRVYRFCDRNPGLELYQTTYTHNPYVIGKLTNFISINSCLEIDLTGQVNAEVAGSRLISGVGGQMDFIRGARLSPGGKAIMAIPSTARGGQVSRIVPRLNQNVPVSTPRAEVDYVVTEYGIAELRYRTLREKAKALISVAHPNFRAELEKASREMF